MAGLRATQPGLFRPRSPDMPLLVRSTAFSTIAPPLSGEAFSEKLLQTYSNGVADRDGRMRDGTSTDAMKDDSGNSSGTVAPKADATQPSLLQTRREDRVHDRADTDFRAFFTDGQYLEGEGTVLDISKSGCRVLCPCDLKEGTTVEVWLFMPNYEWPLRIERALVRWTEGEEFGLQFLTLRPAQRERLRHFLRQHSAPLSNPRTWQ